jgi:predicted Zn-dependent protease
MSNTYIAPGKSTVEEIIANTKLALYAVSLSIVVLSIKCIFSAAVEVVQVV